MDEHLAPRTPPTPAAVPGQVHVTVEALHGALERAAEYRRELVRAALRPRSATATDATGQDGRTDHGSPGEPSARAGAAGTGPRPVGSGASDGSPLPAPPIAPAAGPAMEPDPTGNLHERISWQRRAEPITLADGWFDIGYVFDELAAPPAALAVWWQPATGAVRVQRPRPYTPIQDGPAPKLLAERNAFIR